jgi:pyruvate/2-oxoglutarate/acetoin dehydrogenase E1 component
VAVRTYLEAISDGLREEMRRDERVLVIGEDVGVYGGAFKVTKGFQEEFGEWRVIDAPLAETAIVGACTGAAMMGLRPVAEMQFADFISCCWDHLVTIAAKQHWRTGTSVPIVVRCPSGGGFSGGPFHSQNPESSFAHIPGLKIVCPSTPADAKGLLAAAIRDDDPVVILEPKVVYRTARGEVPAGEHVVPLGKARIARPGSDVTLVAYGAMVSVAERAADELAGVASCEILDLRTLKPLDEPALLESVARTGRAVIVQEAPRTCGFAAEIAAVLAEKAMLDLRAPVLRVTGYDVPYPYWQLEDHYMPSVARVCDAVRRSLAF